MPHAFFSPYLLGVALAARLTGVSPIQALSVAGMLNLLLVLAGLWLFLSILPVEDLPTTAFYTLLFILLLIGPEPPTTSGFLHLRIIGLGLPYPSTFATGLSFVAVYCYARALREGRLRWFGVTLLLAVIVILTHSLTFIFLACAMIALTFGMKELRWMDFARLGLLFALTVGLAALWPYYPFLRLSLGESRIYDAANYGIYLQRVSLAITLLGVPFLVLRLKRNWRDPLVILFALLSGIYAFGYLTQLMELWPGGCRYRSGAGYSPGLGCSWIRDALRQAFVRHARPVALFWRPSSLLHSIFLQNGACSRLARRPPRPPEYVLQIRVPFCVY
jgi:hypothetical protein